MNLLSSLLKYTADQIAALRAKNTIQDSTVSGINTRLTTAEGDIDSLEAQFTTVVSAVTTDTEVTNIRVGDDGVTYDTAGNAVRKQFSDVKSDIGQLPTIETELAWTNSAYIKTGVTVGSVVDVNNPISNNAFGYIIVPVVAGDKFRLNGTGGSASKAWAFTDTSYHLLSNSANDYVATNLLLTAPSNGYLIVNTLLSATHSFVKITNKAVMTCVDEVKSSVGDIPAKKTGISWIKGAYIKTGVTVGTVVSTTPTTQSSYSYAIVPVEAGDTYRLSALGGSDPRTWAFTDTTYALLSKADNEHTSNNELLTAEQDGYLIVNTHTSQVLYKVEPASVAMLINNVAKSITDFGAVGDGVTDDTGAIQLALTECAGGTVIIPSGTFMLSETINVPSGTKFIGEGEDSVLKLVGTGFKLTPFNWRGGQKRPLIYLDPTTSGCVLENFVLIGQPSTFYDQNVEGVSINGKGHIARSLVVHDIDYFPDDFSSRAASVPGIGISVTHASDILVENCKTYNCGYEGIGTDIADNVTISNCKVGNACQTGIQVHMESTNIKVIGNVVAYTGITRPAFTLHADEGHDMSNIYVAHNTFGGALAVISVAENCVSLVENYIGGALSFSDDGYRNNWFIRGNRINGRVVTYVDKSVITDNIINISTGYYMIIHHGNTSVIDNNLGVGSVTDINIITH